ncbi:MAG: hypothetical protein ACW964_05750 [Candidatus Hodarchaeales archaeon]
MIPPDIFVEKAEESVFTSVWSMCYLFETEITDIDERLATNT